jgi:hypothetical protein
VPDETLIAKCGSKPNISHLLRSYIRSLQKYTKKVVTNRESKSENNNNKSDNENENKNKNKKCSQTWPNTFVLTTALAFAFTIFTCV